MSRPVGGHRRRAWRLKKKYDKWFHRSMLEVAGDALRAMPRNLITDLWKNINYDICRIYKK